VRKAPNEPEFSLFLKQYHKNGHISRDFDPRSTNSGPKANIQVSNEQRFRECTNTVCVAAGIVSNANDQSGKVIRESPPVLPLNLCNAEKSFLRMAKSIVRNVTLPLARKNILSHNVR